MEIAIFDRPNAKGKKKIGVFYEEDGDVKFML